MKLPFGLPARLLELQVLSLRVSDVRIWDQGVCGLCCLYRIRGLAMAAQRSEAGTHGGDEWG